MNHGGLTIDSDGRSVAFQDKPVSLTALEFDILKTLLARPGFVFTRELILDAAYAGNNTGIVGAQLTITECTVIGKLHTRLLQLASNSIFFARLGAAPGGGSDSHFHHAGTNGPDASGVSAAGNRRYTARCEICTTQ